MARQKKDKKDVSGGGGGVVEALPHPPTWFRVARWAVFASTVALAIGMLALLDNQLTGIGWTYDGSLAQYKGRPITIEFCLLSSSTDVNNPGRCNFAFAAASISIALAFIWSYLQTLRRNPFRHPSARLADVVLCMVWLLFWLAAAVALCVWTDSANKVGSFLSSARNARNGLCVMAWAEFLLVALLTATAGLLYTKKCQSVFDKWEAKSKAHKQAKEQNKLQKLQAAEQEAAAASAAAASAAAQRKPAAGPGPAAPAGGPAAAATGAHPKAAVQHTGVPVSTGVSSPAAHGPAGAAVEVGDGAVVGGRDAPLAGQAAAAAGAGGGVGGGDTDNPFR